MESLFCSSRNNSLRFRYLFVFILRSSFILLFQIIYSTQMRLENAAETTSGHHQNQASTLPGNEKHPAGQPEDPKRRLAYRCLVYLGDQYRDGGQLGIFVVGVETAFSFSFYCGYLLDHLSPRQTSYDVYLFLNDPGASFRNIYAYLSAMKENLISSHLLYRGRLETDLGQANHSPAAQPSPPAARWFEELSLTDRFTAGLNYRNLHYWPNNRNPEWRASLCKTMVRTYCLLHLIMLPAVTVVLHSTRSIIIGKNHTQLTLLDRSSILVEQVSLFVVADVVYQSFTEFLIRNLDRIKLYNHIDSRMRRFLNAVEHIKAALRQLEGQEASRFLRLSKDYCNREALELYLAYRYFLMTQPTQKIIGTRVMSQFGIGSIGAIISMLSSIWSHDLTIVYWIVFPLLMFCFTFSTVIHAVGSSSSLRLTRMVKLFWSLFGHTNMDGCRLNAGCASSSRKWTQFSEPTTGAPGSSLLHPHTKFLWAQLIRDWIQTADQFTYAILGCYSITYSNMLRINFWVIILSMRVLGKWFL